MSRQRKKASEQGHSRTVQPRGGRSGIKSGQRKRASEPRILTSYRGKRRDSQVNERKLEGGHSLSVKRRRRNESGQRMKASVRGVLTNFRTVGGIISGQQKKPGDRGALTSKPCRVQREERLGSQHSRREPVSEGNSRPVK